MKEHDQRMGDAIAAHEPDYVVLAKVCVLTPEFCRPLPEQIINIHHAFAKCYRRPSPYSSGL